MGDLTLLKGTQLCVCVDETLADIIVVSYVHGTKVFRGALLDATKRNLPCGITELNPAFSAAKPDEDVLYSVKQRYAYSNAKITHISQSATTAPTNRLKNNKIGKMTVRLRPRQVLCSKCKDICTENSESITRKRKAPETEDTPAVVPIVSTSPAKRSANAPVTRSSHAIVQEQQRKKLPNALSGIINKLNIDNNKKAPLMAVATNQGNQNASNIDAPVDDDKRLKRVILTRKKALLAEPLKEETTKSLEQAVGSNTRTIKICYGPQGEGTVLKIPAAIDSLQIDSEEEEDVPEENVVDHQEVANKATRKAMKKAKKAKKKITFQTTIGSPEQSSSRYSSSYSVGSSSPRYTVGSASPRHGLGNNSPRFVATLPPIPLNTLEPTPKKRKHKMKHKKKHKEDRDRKHKEEHKEEKEVVGDKCLTQKLSINLKRLSGTYTTLLVPDTTVDSEQSCNLVEEADKNLVENEDRDMEDESSSDEVPDFPPSPLRLKLSAKNLNSALSSEGSQMIVGDVVWGKIQGLPWWPGKILTITHCDNVLRPQAHVAWYGSSTSSLILCDQLSPYLASFKSRYNKRKRGPYKEAIKQATNEARVLAEFKNSETTATTSTTASASPSRLIMLVQPALASPREINVIS